MTDVVRLSICLEKQLLKKLDQVVCDCKFQNRSEFFRDLVRRKLAERAGHCNKTVLGTITILYSPITAGLRDKIASAFNDRILKKLGCTTIFIDTETTAEMKMVVGKASEIHRLTEELATIKGVIQSSVSYNGLKDELGLSNT